MITAFFPRCVSSTWKKDFFFCNWEKSSVFERKSSSSFLVACYTTLYVTMSVGRSVGWLVGWLVGRSVGQSVGRSVGRSVGFPPPPQPPPSPLYQKTKQKNKTSVTLISTARRFYKRHFFVRNFINTSQLRSIKLKVNLNLIYP